MHRGRVVLVVLAAALCLTGNARAGIIFTNLGSPGALYDPHAGALVSGATSSWGQLVETAFSFSPSDTAAFSELDMALGWVSGTNSVTVELLTDASGLPGSVIQSWTVTGLPTFPGCCTMETLMSSGSTTLTSGVSYWVAALPGSGDTLVRWNTDNNGVAGSDVENNGTGWHVRSTNVQLSAFDVQGQTAPEPSTELPISVALIGLLARLRKR